MNVWIITTGSSDIQLTTDKYWNCLCDEAKQQQDINKKLKFDKKIELTKSVVKPKGIDHPITRFLAPARALGIVYGSAIAKNIEHYNDLDFPLLNNFSKLLQEKKIVFDRIIIIVTDQTNLFTNSEKNQIYCPYWQDTCTLKDILKEYFQKFTYKNAETQPEFLELKLDRENNNTCEKISGLDDWNDVLELVQKELASLQDIPENANIYVSHQAGTPAISSAVQFASLARFRNNVEFLVSNEYNQQAYTIPRSTYLGAIKRQEANALLTRHD